MTFSDTLQAAVDAWVESGGDEQKELEVLTLLDTEDYRSLPYLERNRPFVTSSKLKEFEQCPYHAKLRYVDGLQMGFEEADHFVIGQAVDDWLTHGSDAYQGRYAAVAKRTEKAAEENAGKVLLTNSQAETIGRAVREFQTREFFPERPTKRNVIWLMFGRIPCKAELDHFDPHARRIGDVKTTASITTFDPMDYLFQMGFYYEGILERFDEKVEAELYVVDKHSDWSRSHCWLFTRPTLASVQGRIHHLASRWMDCQETGIWPHVNPDTHSGQRICWSSEFWSVCPFCKTDSKTIL